MKTWIKIAVLAAFTVCGTTASSALASKPAVDRLQSAAAAAPTDNMTPYRNLAADTLKAFKAHDMTIAKSKAKELEKAWDNDQKELKKKSSDVWTLIDNAMDDFIKPIAGKAPDAAKVQTAYETFVAKLQLAVKGPAKQLDDAWQAKSRTSARAIASDAAITKIISKDVWRGEQWSRSLS